MQDSVLITGCGELITLRGLAPHRGKALNDLGIIRNGAILVHEGKIAAIGPRNKIENDPRARSAERIDLGGHVVLPGFVDSHTHLAFAASRADEHEQRIAGATYEQIAKSGGGILSSVRKLRESSHDVLERSALANLRRFAEHGTTTIEAKSGYGLNAEDELKTLKLYAALNAKQPVEIVPTFLGAHVVPPEYRKKKGGASAYIEYLACELLPQIAAAGLAEYCDVFCDRGAFTVAQAKRLLTAARACGLKLRVHAEQLARNGATRLAVELHAASADHLEKLNSADIRALAHSDTVATLLPGCCFHLGEHQSAPARKLIEAGAIVALATDFNPGTSPTLSMPMILSLATAQLRMSPAEATAAATINAACSLGRADRIGSLEVGKFADFAAFDVADYREIPYYFGVNLCVFTMKRGKVLHSRLHG